jgi:hypothetical protein
LKPLFDGSKSQRYTTASCSHFIDPFGDFQHFDHRASINATNEARAPNPEHLLGCLATESNEASRRRVSAHASTPLVSPPQRRSIDSPTPVTSFSAATPIVEYQSTTEEQAPLPVRKTQVFVVGSVSNRSLQRRFGDVERDGRAICHVRPAASSLNTDAPEVVPKSTELTPKTTSAADSVNRAPETNCVASVQRSTVSDVTSQHGFAANDEEWSSAIIDIIGADEHVALASSPESYWRSLRDSLAALDSENRTQTMESSVQETRTDSSWSGLSGDVAESESAMSRIAPSCYQSTDWKAEETFI